MYWKAVVQHCTVRIGITSTNSAQQTRYDDVRQTCRYCNSSEFTWIIPKSSSEDVGLRKKLKLICRSRDFRAKSIIFVVTRVLHIHKLNIIKQLRITFILESILNTLTYLLQWWGIFHYKELIKLAIFLILKLIENPVIWKKAKKVKERERKIIATFKNC